MQTGFGGIERRLDELRERLARLEKKKKKNLLIPMMLSSEWVNRDNSSMGLFVAVHVKPAIDKSTCKYA